jgi:hypothetical protein
MVTALVVGIGLPGLAASCGPESYMRGPREDAAREVDRDSAGTGGQGQGQDQGNDGAGGTDGGAPDTPGCGMQGYGGFTGDGSVPPFSMSWTFDGVAGLQGWSPVGMPPEVVQVTTTALDSQDGFPDPGSARVMIPFSGNNQQVAYGFNFSGPQNFAGKVLTARVRLNSCNPSGTIMVGLAYKSIPSIYLFASSVVRIIVATNGWVTFQLSFDAPDGFVDMTRKDVDGGILAPDPTAVLEIDILILTGAPPYTLADVSIDTVGISE